MNVERLEHLKELCGRKLQKDYQINMRVWQRTTIPELGVNCETAGCLAGLIGTDSYFTNLGYQMNVHKAKDQPDGFIFYQPEFENRIAFRALRRLFGLDDGQTKYIFGGHNSDRLEDAIWRIDKILDGKTFDDEIVFSGGLEDI